MRRQSIRPLGESQAPEDDVRAREGDGSSLQTPKREGSL